MSTSQPVDPLFKTLRSRAIGAHRRIRDGLRHGVDQQETTITDTLLLELKRRAPGVIIHTLTQREEAKHGADWEWWFKGGNRWFGMLVRAKRLRPTTHGAFGYNFAYRTGGKGTRQIDRLLDDARARIVQQSMSCTTAPISRCQAPGDATCYPVEGT